MQSGASVNFRTRCSLPGRACQSKSTTNENLLENTGWVASASLLRRKGGRTNPTVACAVARCSLLLLTCTLLMTSSHSKAWLGPTFAQAVPQTLPSQGGGRPFGVPAPQPRPGKVGSGGSSSKSACSGADGGGSCIGGARERAIRTKSSRARRANGRGKCQQQQCLGQSCRSSKAHALSRPSV